jgi:hypothetical protein
MNTGMASEPEAATIQEVNTDTKMNRELPNVKYTTTTSSDGCQYLRRWLKARAELLCDFRD